MEQKNLYVTKLGLIHQEIEHIVSLCFCYLPLVDDCKKILQHFHIGELSYYHSFKFEKRKKTYLIGRFVAKQAVAALISEQDLKTIDIQSGIFYQPIIVPNCHNIHVSITHCDDIGAALAFPEAHPMGIDLEMISVARRRVLEGQVTAKEIEIIKSLSISYDVGLTLMWTAKEALSKVLKTGLMTPFEIFEISGSESYDNYAVSSYKNFNQYKVMSFLVSDYVCSIVYPNTTQLSLNIKLLQDTFTCFSVQAN